MKWLVGICIALALTVAAEAQETRIVAVVNSDIVTAEDLNARMMLFMRSSSIPDTPQNRQQLMARVLSSLIDEKLELQEAAKYKVTVSNEEVNKALQNIEARNNMPKGGLDEYLKSAGIPRSTLVNQIKTSLIWNKVVENHYGTDVSVSDAEVKERIARIKEDLGKPQSHVAEIFLAVDNPTQDAEVKALADRLIAQIRGGANFASVAQQFSQTSSAASGGDIGWVTPDDLGSPLGDALPKMSPGQISYPIRTPAGYYVLYVIERRTPGQTSVNDTQVGLVEVILPLSSTASPQARDGVMAAAQHITDTAKSCGEMAKFAHDEGPELSTQTPSIRIGDLPADLRTLVLGLKVAEPSKPLPTRGGIGVIMVCQRTDPPSPIPTTDQVYDQISRARMDQIARRYLQDLRRSAYLDVRG